MIKLVGRLEFVEYWSLPTMKGCPLVGSQA